MVKEELYMKTLKSVLPRAALIFLIFTIVCSVVYTGVVTGLAQLIFPNQANGSIIEVDGKKYGCELLGQQYTDDAHMWGRIMNIDVSTYTDENGKALMYASPSNLSPASEEYQALVDERVQKIKQPILIWVIRLFLLIWLHVREVVLTHIFLWQLPNIKFPDLLRQIIKTEDEIRAIIDKCKNGRFIGIFGEETVNVLKVNLMLDGILKE